MNLKIDIKTLKLWLEALYIAEDKEIGGVLFGEHIESDVFKVLEITTQFSDGDQSNFKRNGDEARDEIKKIRSNFKDDNKRYNYLGEWHSHPNSAAVPSETDDKTMFKILGDSTTNANFLVLIILRLAGDINLELSARTYLCSGQIIECKIEIES
tara:strand:+ start:3254 stop:3718 length:465 start_codon:yes stop_codon:yes gene_type:complete